MRRLLVMLSLMLFVSCAAFSQTIVITEVVTKYYCDRCNVEVSSDVKKVFYGYVHPRPLEDAVNKYQYVGVEKELCESCYEDFGDMFDVYFSTYTQ